MFAVLHSDINSIKSGPLHLTGQLKSRVAKVKDGIRISSLWNYLIDQYSTLSACTPANIILGWKSLLETNTLDYYENQ